MSEDEAKEKILRLTEAEARKYKHAAITFNHLLAALIQSSPREISTILGPKIKLSTLLAMLDTDMRDTGRHPQNPVSGAPVRLSKEAGSALRRAAVAVEPADAGGRGFAAELLNAMLSASELAAAFHNGAGRDERSTTLDYIRMVLSPPPPAESGAVPVKNPNNHGGGDNFGWQAPYVALGIL